MNLSKNLFALSALLLTFGPAVRTASADELVAVKVGRAITVSGDDIENATILIKAGRIEAIGKDVKIPAEARVIDRREAVAMPGIVDVHTTTGLRVPNERLADVPYVSVLDGIDPSSTALEAARRNGVTTIHCISSNSTRFGGQGAVIRSSGRFVDSMIVKSPSAMKISLATTSGESRMGSMAVLRKRFFDLYSRMKSLEEDKSGKAQVISKEEAAPTIDSLINIRPTWEKVDWKKVPEDKIPERERAMVDLVRGKLPAFVYCPTATDVFKAFEIIDANNLKTTLVLNSDGYKLVDVLKGRKNLGPVVLSPTFEMWETDDETGKRKRHLIPKLFHDAGIPFVIQAGGYSSSSRGTMFSRSGYANLWYQAARLVKYGVPRKKAIETITIEPAKVLGLGHRVGSLEVGKDADIAIFYGDPLDARSWVELVLIEGEEVYDRKKDRDLELLLRAPERPF